MPKWNPRFEDAGGRALVRNSDFVLVNDKQFECRKTKKNPNGKFRTVHKNTTTNRLDHGPLKLV
jgi:hypothetical protein